jgi:hypothetical protein
MSGQINLEVNLNGGTHCSLDVDLTNVLPLFLEETGQEIGSKLSVDTNLLAIHRNISDGNIKTHNFLHLELDGGLNLINLFLHVFATSKQGGELSGLGKTRTQQTRDLFDHVVRSKEEIVFLGKLFDHLLVLVKLFQILNTHVVNTNAVRLFTVSSVTQHAALHLRARDTGELECSRKTFITDRIVVFQRNLDFDCFGEVALLSFLVLAVDMNIFAVGEGNDVVDSLFKDSRVQLRHDFFKL